jgi:hypothetical protein
MEKLFDLSEIVPTSPLAAIPLLFQAGQIPDDLLPKTAEDWTAISILQSRIWPIDQLLVSKIAQTLEQRLPIENLCFQAGRGVADDTVRTVRNFAPLEPGKF